ncbi:MAG: helix-turn-helix transcriptional regulator [Planctomycetota bacterium]|jgi:hypothetical protein
MSAPHDVLLYADEIGTLCRVSEDTARRWIADGRFGPALTVGRYKAVLASEFEAYWRREFDRKNALSRAPSERKRRRGEHGRFAPDDDHAE